MSEQIDWLATMDEWEGWAWDSYVGSGPPMLRLADPRGLCTEWRNLALQEKERADRAEAALRECKAGKPAAKWPFR